MNVPCKDCKDRQVGCHGTCELYKQFQAENETVKRIRQLEKEGSMYTIQQCISAKRKRRKK